MQTLSQNIKQQKSNNYADRRIFKGVADLQIFDDVMESHEPKNYLHPNYCHWAWLAKPK